MIHKSAIKVVTMLLCVVMVIGMFPMTAFAAIPNWETENVTYDKTTFGTNDYYNVISKKDYILVPGAATETELVLNNATGTRRQVLHIIEVDPSNPDVSLIPGYYNIDKDITDVANQQAAKLTDMAKYYEDNLGYNIVGGMNTDLYYTANAPRVLVYNGKDMRDYGSTNSVLCVYQAEDGTVTCDVKAYSKATMDDELANGHATRGKLLHAVGVSFAMTVKDGELVNKTEERTTSAAARSMVGVKEDGTLVICMNDGRGANNSIGFCNYELGESMLALGCKWAANCDGGGSSTFISKRVGEDEFTMRSVPCDGAERPTIHGIFVTSNVGPTGELDYTEIESEYDYFAPGTTYKFAAKGIDTNGYQMDIPAGATWAVSDAAFGSITADGIFTSAGVVGEVDIQMILDGKVIGSRTVTIANPTLSLSASSTVIPYSTADKIRTISLPIVAKIGEADVYYDVNVFDIALSNEAAGVINGFNFTATTDESIAAVEISAKYLPTGEVLKYSVEFGKGSETIWNFEDGELGGFLGQDDAYKWQEENGKNPMSGIIAGGNRSDEIVSKSFLATRENGGKVHNGNYAVGYEIDMRNVDFNNWVYANVYNVSDSIVLRDVASGKKATTLGMWVYVPEGFYTVKNAGALAMRFDLMAGTDADNLKRTNFDATYNGKKINSLKESDIPENRWIYINVDLTTHNYVRTHDSRNGAEGYSPNLIRMYVKPSEAQILTYYFDEVTLDYSSAVDDREPPVISDVTYCVNDTNIALDGNNINSNTISFNANVSDFVKNNAEGLDYNSAKIYIDGIEVAGVKASSGTMSLENAVLSNGTHKITFEIADRLGNSTQVTKAFTVEASNAASAITFGGHNDLGNVPMYKSVYYLDLIAEDISKISSVTTEIALHTSSVWELENMILAEGFTSTYSYNDITKIATINITKTGNCTLSGKQILASLPTRTFDSTFCGKNGGPVVNVEAAVVSGSIVYTDNKMGSFSGDVLVATEINANFGAWHVHDTELSVLNKEATCNEYGYSDRTYCETCGSVIEWGKKAESKGHNYILENGKFVCSECDGTLDAGTGLIEINGKAYYSIAGNLVTGWQNIDGEKYYFDKTTFEGLNGVYKSSQLCSTSQKFEYSFTNGKLDSGVWVKMAMGTRYYYGESHYGQGTFVIDGKTYGFNASGYRYEGLCVIKWNPRSAYQLFEYTDEGVYVGERKDSGVFTTTDGSIYYLTDGIASIPGLVQDANGDFYFFGHGYMTARLDGTYYIAASATNGLLPEGRYTFGADGKMLQGVVKGEDGNVRYYVNGAPAYAGLVQDENGDYYYISGSTMCAVTNTTRYITFTNGLLPEGRYTFGADGKMLQGVVKGEDGNVRYYVNGAPAYAGLVQDENGDYYYISGSTMAAIKDTTRYITFTNDLLPEGKYSFGPDGKMLQGIVKGADGKIRYYVNGAPAYAGLVQDENGDYYYISGSTMCAVTNTTRYITFTNGLVPIGNYTFGADGKMVTKHGVVKDDDGNIRYYVQGVATYAGLVKDYNGDYYYISGSTMCAVKNTTRYITFTNGLLPEGSYTFGADGKMIVK